MEHLIDLELEELEQMLDKYPHLSNAFPNSIIDPCPKYCDVLEDTALWYSELEIQGTQNLPFSRVANMELGYTTS
jgi:hypothetical protein